MPSSHPLRNSILISTALVALIWVLKCLELLLSVDFYHLGVYPRTAGGLSGILTAPLIHGSWEHLVGNTFPLLILGSMLFLGYPRSRFWALAGIWLFSGAAVWLFARSSYHFGASGLTHGIFFYLLLGGLIRRDIRSAALLMVAFYLYGGMLLTILPRDPGVSFESHFFGAVAGSLCAYLFRNWDPKPARKRYPWERVGADNRGPEEDDPVIGDQWRTGQQGVADDDRPRPD